MNVNSVLTQLKINATSHLYAVQDVREIVEASADPIGAARTIINSLTLVGDHTISDAVAARMTAQYLVQDAIVLGSKYDPQESLAKAAAKIAGFRISDPYFFSRGVVVSEAPVVKTEGSVQVAVKADGKIKKGGKKVLAQELYAKHKSLDNKSIVEIFMKALDMSKAGATTYLNNCKKAAK